MAHRAFQAEFLIIRGHYAARFLTAMLQRVKSQISESRRFRVAVDTEDPALFVEFVVKQIDHVIEDYRAFRSLSTIDV